MMAQYVLKLLGTLVVAAVITLCVSQPYQGFAVVFLIPVLVLLFAVRLSQARKYPEERWLQYARVAIWLVSMAVIFTAHHYRAAQWRETADRAADKVNEYSAREGRCPKNLDRWITPDEAKAIHLIYFCDNGKPSLIYMDSFEVAARYYYRFDKREWEWNSG